MLHVHDRAGLLAARHLPLPHDLRAVVRARVDTMEGQGLLDLSELLVIDRDVTEADVVDALGWSPLVAADGRRLGDPGFVAPFDYVHATPSGHHVAVQLVGNAGFAFELVVCPDADTRFVAACRGHVA